MAPKEPKNKSDKEHYFFMKKGVEEFVKNNPSTVALFVLDKDGNTATFTKDFLTQKSFITSMELEIINQRQSIINRMLAAHAESKKFDGSPVTINPLVG